jgi:hypothetical protein
MFLKSKILIMVAAIGYGVLFSLALTGGVRMVCWLLGTELPTKAAGNVFLTSSLLAGAVSAYASGHYARLSAPAALPSSAMDQHFLV